MYNPIIGIFELKRFRGLRDLPAHEDGTARILRSFGSGNKEIYLNLENAAPGFWERFWRKYSDCVFVDMSTHAFSQVIPVDHRDTDIETGVRAEVLLSFHVQVSDPVSIVRRQILDTREYFHRSLREAVLRALDREWPSDCKALSEVIKESLGASEGFLDMFSLSNIEVDVVIDDSNGMMNGNEDDLCRDDIRRLFAITDNSDLDIHEQEKVKRTILKGPE